MFSAKTIEITIGLVFFYLLFSLLVTTINEMISGIFDLRGKQLKNAIGNMLGDKHMEKFYDHPLIKTSGKILKLRIERIKRTRKPSYIRSENFAQVVTEIVSNELFFKRKELEGLLAKSSNAPIIGGLSAEKTPEEMNLKEVQKRIEDETIKTKEKEGDKKDKTKKSGKSKDSTLTIDAKPKEKTSYGEAVDADWKGLAETIEGMDFPDDTKAMILSLAKRSGGDMTIFKKHLENWFESMMERLKGWYVRYLKLITFGVALVIAIAFNADTFRVVQSLNSDSVRKEMLGAATQYMAAAKTNISPIDSQRSESDTVLLSRINRLGNQVDSLINDDIANSTEILGLGWNAENTACDENYCSCECAGTADCKDSCDCWKKIGCGLKKLSGWLLTAIALSLGAPFWFDLLKKLISIRSAGVNPGEGKKEGEPADG